MHPGPQRNDEYVAPAKAKAISRLIRSLCSEVRRGRAAQRRAAVVPRPWWRVSSCRSAGLPLAAALARSAALARPLSLLCPQIRSVALPLVAAWGVPDHILRAPIGLGTHSGVDIYKVGPCMRQLTPCMRLHSHSLYARSHERTAGSARVPLLRLLACACCCMHVATRAGAALPAHAATRAARCKPTPLTGVPVCCRL